MSMKLLALAFSGMGISEYENNFSVNRLKDDILKQERSESEKEIWQEYDKVKIYL